MSKTFEEELGEDIGYLKNKVDTMLTKTEDLTTTDTELRAMLLNRADAFYRWFNPLIEIRHTFTSKELDYIEQALYDKDIAKNFLQDSSVDEMKHLISQRISLISSPGLLTYRESLVYKAMDSLYARQNLFELCTLLENIIIEDNKKEIPYTPLEVFEWFITKVGFYQVNLTISNMYQNNYETCRKNKGLLRYWLSYGASVQASYTYRTGKIIMNDYDLIKNMPMRQRDIALFASSNSNITYNNSDTLLRDIRNNPTNRILLTYFFNTKGDEFFRDPITMEYDYSKPPYEYDNALFDLDPVFVQRVFDSQIAYNAYFAVLMNRFPLYGYITLVDLKKYNGNKYITSFTEMVNVATTKIPNAQHRERIKAQIPYLANMYGHLTDSGLEKYPFLQDAFQITIDRPLHNQMFRYMLTVFEGLGPVFLYMLDSGQYNKFFELIVNIPGLAIQIGSQFAANSSENFYYCLIPWIATNRLGDFIEAHMNATKAKPIVSSLLKIETGEFGEFWAKHLISSKMRGTEFPAGYKDKIARLPSVDSLISNYTVFEKLYLDIKPTVIDNELHNILKQFVAQNPQNISLSKGATVTLKQLRSLKFKSGLDVANMATLAPLLAYNIIDWSHFTVKLQDIAKSKDLQYRLANTMGSWTGRFAKTLLELALQSKDWQMARLETTSNFSSFRPTIKGHSNNSTVPLLIFYGFGTTGEANPNITQVAIFAKTSDNDTGNQYKAKKAELLKGTVSFDNVQHGNCGYRLDTVDRMKESVAGAWFEEIDAFDLGPGAYLTTLIFRYVGD